MEAILIRRMDALCETFKQEGYKADIKIVLIHPRIMLVVLLTDKDIDDIRKMDCDIRVVEGG